MMKHYPARGFTFIELLIVVALVGTILSFSIVMGTDSIARGSVKEERDLLVSLILTGARARAIANVHGTAHGVHVDTDAEEYVLFEGITYTPESPTNRAIPFAHTHVSVTHSEEMPDIVFEALSGNVRHGAGIITIAHNEISLDVTLNEVGQIDW
jgi:prepilin-type N-terminal cleavage/methylation domain-containing protein